MIKKTIFCFLFLLLGFSYSYAQEYFTIKDYGIKVKVNQDASLDITENLLVHFTEPRHGIFRMIPFRYQKQEIPAGTEKATLQLSSEDYTRTIIEKINVEGWHFETSTEGDYKSIKIGSANQLVDGDQRYIIHYTVLNAINFFKDHAELYFNLVGDKWPVDIAQVHFSIILPNDLQDTSKYFVATGYTGSTENKTNAAWENNKVFTGYTTETLSANQGVTVGIAFPKDFLVQPNYNMRGIGWLTAPLLVFLGMFTLWRKKGKDEKRTVTTEFYPPEDIVPPVAGYIIDNTLEHKDLTSLVPYWGANGYLQINETEKKSLAGLISTTKYEFVKLKSLPPNSHDFEKTIFNGIFETGDHVDLDDLKNKLYTKMSTARTQLSAEIKRDNYYEKGSRTLGCLFPTFGFILLIFGVILLVSFWFENKWLGIAFILSAVVVLIFGFLMVKKTPKGNELYYKLLGFKEFIKSVEKDRLQAFLKQDPSYFEKVLPYAIVFNLASEWKDKLQGLDIPPPTWWNHGNYSGSNFNTMMFMDSFNSSMSAMTSTFNSSPSSSGSSGGSFGGGGFSGGGGGGGGGGSW